MDFLQDREIYESVVEEGILKARQSVLISTANVKNIHIPLGKRRSVSLVDVLIDLANKDIFVQILHASVPSARFRDEAEDKGLYENPNVSFFNCPRVHFKAVIIDHAWIYLGSANLTGAGFGAKSDKKRNFEMGFTSTDKKLIQTVADRFNEITEKKLCPPCHYYKNCWG